MRKERWKRKKGRGDMRNENGKLKGKWRDEKKRDRKGEREEER